MPGVVLAAQLLDEAVISPSGQNRALTAGVRRDELEDGARVVIKAAHKRVIDLVAYAKSDKTLQKAGPVYLRLVGEVVDALRGVGQQRLHLLVLGVEHTQGVFL